MNKFKVGQKVKIIRTGKIGRIESIDSEDFNTDGCSKNCYEIKVKEKIFSNWFTVHDLEEVKEILDAEEKEYLGNVIRPFRNRVTGIRKIFSLINSRHYFSVEIFLKSVSKKQKYEVILLPAFHSKMYKNMEVGKEYTLEELGL